MRDGWYPLVESFRGCGDQGGGARVESGLRRVQRRRAHRRSAREPGDRAARARSGSACGERAASRARTPIRDDSRTMDRARARVRTRPVPRSLRLGARRRPGRRRARAGRTLAPVVQSAALAARGLPRIHLLALKRGPRRHDRAARPERRARAERRLRDAHEDGPRAQADPLRRGAHAQVDPLRLRGRHLRRAARPLVAHPTLLPPRAGRCTSSRARQLPSAPRAAAARTR